MRLHAYTEGLLWLQTLSFRHPRDIISDMDNFFERFPAARLNRDTTDEQASTRAQTFAIPATTLTLQALQRFL